MHAFDVLGDPVRRRILELLADNGELTSGAMCAVIQREFGITQPGVSAHLRILRESGFATAHAEGARRLYAVNPAGLRDVNAWLDRFRRFWTPHLDALETELARGRRERERRQRRHRSQNNARSTPNL
jgi:DNA-binding transcriptional ArsR family regulator